jgi:uncharacterized protein YjfI (DUF2170 family)
MSRVLTDFGDLSINLATGDVSEIMVMAMMIHYDDDDDDDAFL